MDKYHPIHEYNLASQVNHMILIKDEHDQYVGTGNIYFDAEHLIIDDISVLVEARGKGLAKMFMFI
ncbi:GNAT family N-acetyltransferase [Mesoplasma melaleucae]|uniref:GNAT family N-acetyltransferase n=1 Tax=Mesoplasma melaleucae TaxID=81459 RepID=UPI000487E1D7|nr:GNAT family N-acetyltransferase [Mesoplasma melaleucae]